MIGLSRRRVRTRKPLSEKRRVKEMMRRRSLLMVVCIMFGFTAMLARLVVYGLVPADEPVLRLTQIEKDVPVRADILDRNGVLLATSLKVHSLYADPKMMLDITEAVQQLDDLFPQIDWVRMKERFKNRNRRFVWVKRHLTPEQVHTVNALGIPGIGFKEEVARVYPHGHLFSHVLGSVNVDGDGVSGAEKTYNKQLVDGDDLYLTLDVRLQSTLHDTLQKNLERTEAKASWGMVSDPMTGDVLAMVSLPDFDPNNLQNTADEAWANRNLNGSYEMGSTFKIFTMAQGIEQGFIHEETMLDVTRPIRIGKYTIRDYYPRYEIMPVSKAFRRSSNIGTARVVDMFGPEAQRDFFAKLGFLSPIDVGLDVEASTQFPRRWSRIGSMTMSYGHGIAVTPVHMVAAVGAIVGDGMYRTPSIALHAVRDAPFRVVEESTVDAMRGLMKDVVQNGTARRAKLVGYNVGGKTGTAEKAVAGGYSDSKNIASFVGAVPIDDPQFVAIVMVDEGKKGLSTGGVAAAPAFKDLAMQALPILAVRPKLDTDTNDLRIQKAGGYASFGFNW